MAEQLAVKNQAQWMGIKCMWLWALLNYNYLLSISFISHCFLGFSFTRLDALHLLKFNGPEGCVELKICSRLIRMTPSGIEHKECGFWVRDFTNWPNRSCATSCDFAPWPWLVYFVPIHLKYAYIFEGVFQWECVACVLDPQKEHFPCWSTTK